MKTIAFKPNLFIINIFLKFLTMIEFFLANNYYTF